MNDKKTIAIIGAGKNTPLLTEALNRLKSSSKVETVTIMKTQSCGITECIAGRGELEALKNLGIVLKIDDLVNKAEESIPAKPKKRGKYWKRSGYGKHCR